MSAGSTSQALPIFINDTSSTTGAGLGSLVFNTSGLTAKYRRQGSSSWTAISLQTMTLGTWASGGFIADGGVAGGYEFGVPDAALASGAGVGWVEIQIYGAANMLPVLIFIELDSVNYQSANNFMTGVGGHNAIFDSNGYPGVNLVDVAGQPANYYTGQAQTGTATTITLASSDSSPNNGYAGRQITIVGGTGAGQSAYISAYNSTTKVATTYCTAGTSGHWITTPDSTSLYSIDQSLDVNVALWLQSVPGAFPTNFSSLSVSSGGLVRLDTTQTLSAARALDSIADTSLTLNDAFHCAVSDAAGKESVSGTTYLKKTPSTGTTIRTFTLDQNPNPTSRS
jgi:hypothetical protein